MRYARGTPVVKGGGVQAATRDKWLLKGDHVTSNWEDNSRFNLREATPTLSSTLARNVLHTPGRRCADEIDWTP